MLTEALGWLGALAVAAQQVPPLPARELPVVTLDGPAGAVSTLGPALQRPGPLPSLPVTRLDDRGRSAELDVPRALSLTFARPLPLRDVLFLLFRGTPFSVVLDPAVRGTFTGELKDVTLRQATESVLSPAGQDYDVTGTVIRVFPRRPRTRFFTVDHLQHTRAGADFYAELGAGVQSILSSTGKSHVNRKAGLIQVTDFADRLDTVAAYVETAHLRVNRQVRLEAHVMEISTAGPDAVDWPSLAARPRSGIRRTEGAAGWRVDDAGALARTLGEVASVRHITTLVLLAMNNEPATLRAEDAAGELRLTVTPQIASDGIIHMHVAPAYVDGRKGVTTPADGGGPFSASVDTVVRIAGGDTVLMRGFTRQREGAGRAELVVLLTATTVVPGAPAGATR